MFARETVRHPEHYVTQGLDSSSTSPSLKNSEGWKTPRRSGSRRSRRDRRSRRVRHKRRVGETRIGEPFIREAEEDLGRVPARLARSAAASPPLRAGAYPRLSPTPTDLVHGRLLGAGMGAAERPGRDGTRIGGWVFHDHRLPGSTKRGRPNGARVASIGEADRKPSPIRRADLETGRRRDAAERALLDLPDGPAPGSCLVLVEGLSYREAADVMERRSMTSQPPRGRIVPPPARGDWPGAGRREDPARRVGCGSRRVRSRDRPRGIGDAFDRFPMPRALRAVWASAFRRSSSLDDREHPTLDPRPGHAKALRCPSPLQGDVNQIVGRRRHRG